MTSGSARSLGFLVAIALMWGSAGPALGHGDLHERIEVLTERLEQSPRDVELLLRRADLFRQHEEFGAALRDVDAAERLGGREADVLLLRGRTLLEYGRAGDAIDALEGFVEVRPEHGEGWLLLARARRGTADHRASVAAYGRAIELMEWAGPEVYLERADEVLEAELGGANTEVREPGRERVAREKALDGIEEGVERLGPVVTLEVRAAELEVELGRVDAATARIDAVMAQAARKEVWLVRKAEILARAGREEDALGTYRAALEATRGTRGAARDRALREEIECAIARLEGAQASDERRDTVEANDAGG